mmetsp:Transcript_29149/g.53195  ORF Transcript_29149/g.53195 Transcript_29149/m.53195 type:complete len:269 (+) Transcript_29149:79-885(+)
MRLLIVSFLLAGLTCTVLGDRGSHDAGAMVGFSHELASELKDVHRHRHRGNSVLENSSDTEDDVQRDINDTREELEKQLKLMKDDEKRLSSRGREAINKVEQDLQDGNMQEELRDTKKLEAVIADESGSDGSNDSEPLGETTTTPAAVEEVDTTSTVANKIQEEVAKGSEPPTWEECENCTQMEAYAAAKSVFEKLVGWKEATIQKADTSRRKNDEYGEAFSQADGTLNKIGNETEMNADFDADQRSAAAILIGQKDELEEALSNLTA